MLRTHIVLGMDPVPVDEMNSRAWAEVAFGSRIANHVLRATSRPSADSNFAKVDALYPHEKASDWNRSYLLSALEHLVLWADMVAPLRFHPDHRVLHTLRPAYTLARAAIESAAQSVWMTSGGSALECARRHLALVRWDFMEQRKSTTTAEAKQQMTARDVQLLARSAHLFQERDLRPPTQYDVLRAAAPVLGVDPDLLESVWRAASGAAHGRVWPSLALQHVVPLSEYEPGQFETIRLPDADRMTEALQLAERIAMHGVLRHADFCGADIGTLLEEARLWLVSVIPLREDADPTVLDRLNRREQT